MLLGAEQENAELRRRLEELQVQQEVRDHGVEEVKQSIKVDLQPVKGLRQLVGRVKHLLPLTAA